MHKTEAENNEPAVGGYQLLFGLMSRRTRPQA